MHLWKLSRADINGTNKNGSCQLLEIEIRNNLTKYMKGPKEIMNTPRTTKANFNKLKMLS